MFFDEIQAIYPQEKPNRLKQRIFRYAQSTCLTFECICFLFSILISPTPPPPKPETISKKHTLKVNFSFKLFYVSALLVKGGIHLQGISFLKILQPQIKAMRHHINHK